MELISISIRIDGTIVRYVLDDDEREMMITIAPEGVLLTVDIYGVAIYAGALSVSDSGAAVITDVLTVDGDSGNAIITRR